MEATDSAQSASASIVPLPYQRSFLRAHSALCDDNVATARSLLQNLAAALPDNLDVRLYLAWACALASKSISDGEHEELESLARQILKTQRSSPALPSCILAHSALRRGDLQTAYKLFRSAALEEPALIDARRGMRTVEQRLKRGSHAHNPAKGFIAVAIVLVGIAVAIIKATT